MGMFVHEDTESTHDDHSMFCHYTADKAQPIQQAPKHRFTAEEREAMILIGDTCNAYLHNYRFGTAEYVKLYGAIATVRKMLEE